MFCSYSLFRYKLAKDHIIEKIKEISFKTNEKVLSEEAKKVLPILVLIFNVFQNLRSEVVRILRGKIKFSL